MTQTILDIAKLSDRIVANTFDTLAAIVESLTDPVSDFADGITGGHNAATRPTSSLLGFAITSSYGGTDEMDFWNTKESTAATSQGFSWYQKLTSSSEQKLMSLTGNASQSTLTLTNTTPVTAIWQNDSVCKFGTTTNHAVQFYQNNANVATINTSGQLECQLANTRICTSLLSKTNDTALELVPGMSVALQAGKAYGIRIWLCVSSGASGGVKVALVGTNGLTATTYRAGSRIYSGTAINLFTADVTTLGNNVAAQTAIETDVEIDGYILVNAAGTLEVQFAQNASNGTASTCKLGSYMTLTRAT